MERSCGMSNLKLCEGLLRLVASFLTRPMRLLAQSAFKIVLAPRPAERCLGSISLYEYLQGTHFSPLTQVTTSSAKAKGKLDEELTL